MFLHVTVSVLIYLFYFEPTRMRLLGLSVSLMAGREVRLPQLLLGPGQMLTTTRASNNPDDQCTFP